MYIGVLQMFEAIRQILTKRFLTGVQIVKSQFAKTLNKLGYNYLTRKFYF